MTEAEGQFERNGLGYWSVREVPGGPVIGRGGCTILTGRTWWNLYYRFATAVHGRGYATEMGLRAIEAARDVEPARPVRGLPAGAQHRLAAYRRTARHAARVAGTGPAQPRPRRDPAGVRRPPADRELVAAIEAHALGG